MKTPTFVQIIPQAVGIYLACMTLPTRALEGIESAAAGDHEEPGGEPASCRIEIPQPAKSFDEDDLREAFSVASFVIQKGGNHTEQAILAMKNKVFKGLDLPVDYAASSASFIRASLAPITPAHQHTS